MVVILIDMSLACPSFFSMNLLNSKCVVCAVGVSRGNQMLEYCNYVYNKWAASDGNPKHFSISYIS